MKDYKKSIEEAKEYVEIAENRYRKNSDRSLNPAAVNCIMAMIKTVDGLMLKYRGSRNKDHSKTANKLKELYKDNLISKDFSSNVDTVRKMVVDKKTGIQYRNKKISGKELKRGLKSSKRLLEKAKKELNIDQI